MIEDKERFITLLDEDSIRVFLLGEHIWRELYTAIRNVNSKHKDAHHKELVINPNFVSSYSLSGFVLCFKYTPRVPPVEYDGLFGDYLKKLSPARTLREKDREAWSEIKILKACVYKLETITNVITPKTKAKIVKHKVNTSGKKDKVESVSKQCDLGDKYAFDDLVDENTKLEKVDKVLSQDDYVKAKKQEAEQRRLRLQLMLEEENSMKSIDHSNSTRIKLSLEKCRTTKMRYVNVLMTPMEVDTEIKGPSMDILKNQKNVFDAYIIERYQDLKPWKEFLSSSGWRHCKFPWCNDVVVDRPFWDNLIGLDDNRLGWLHEEHIDLWVWYIWYFRQSCQDCSIASCKFLTLLLRESMPLFYATDEIYPLAYRDVEQFHIKFRNVTFYDSQETFDVEIRSWYVKTKRCLESKLPVVLQETSVFVSKGIDPTHYSIKFRHAKNIPKQGGGIWLAHKILLDVEDPIQTVMAYREKMINFFFDHKIIFPS
uniref:Phospholipase-like protein n=1 Tax=Tanacetum cinerariifolium TaxID=118510 RepID=A0A6L2NTC1_TANCI|nr:phospholipase-like protein [Tanacetum cinerariifolium]